MNRLYHAEVFFKDWFEEVAVDLFNTNYSRHLRNHFAHDRNKTRYSMTEDKLTSIIEELISGERDYYLYEVEVEEPLFMVKAVIRTSYNDTHDVSIVFAFDNNDYNVRTAWINAKTDKHYTLDKSKYWKG